MIKKEDINWKEVELFFFEAMLNGWITDAKELVIPLLPGCKIITYRHGGFHLADCFYAVTGSTSSSGMTAISFNDIPIWTMIYNGWHSIEVIPFLKIVLLETYEARHFYGGRGRDVFKRDGFTYNNTPSLGSSKFTFFSGSEILFKPGNGLGDVLAGCYNYKGGSLV